MTNTGYQIQNIKDRLNAFTDDQNQLFETLEEAREWADSVWENIEWADNDAHLDEDERTKKDDLIVAYYERGVQRGDYPLFE